MELESLSNLATQSLQFFSHSTPLSTLSNDFSKDKKGFESPFIRLLKELDFPSSNPSQIPYGSQSIPQEHEYIVHNESHLSWENNSSLIQSQERESSQPSIDESQNSIPNHEEEDNIEEDVSKEEIHQTKKNVVKDFNILFLKDSSPLNHNSLYNQSQVTTDVLFSNSFHKNLETSSQSNKKISQESFVQNTLHSKELNQKTISTHPDNLNKAQEKIPTLLEDTELKFKNIKNAIERDIEFKKSNSNSKELNQENPLAKDTPKSQFKSNELEASWEKNLDKEFSTKENPILLKKKSSQTLDGMKDTNPSTDKTNPQFNKEAFSNENLTNHKSNLKNEKYRLELKTTQVISQSASSQPNPTTTSTNQSSSPQEVSSLSLHSLPSSSGSRKGFTDSQSSFQENKFLWNASSLRKSLDSTSSSSEALWSSQDKRDAINRLIEQAKIQILGNQKSMAEIRLRPEELGRMVLKIQVNQDKVEGKIFVDSETVRSALLNELGQLREEFRSQGLRLESLEIDLSFQSNKDSGRNGAFLDGEDLLLDSLSLGNKEKSDSNNTEEVYNFSKKTLLDVIA